MISASMDKTINIWDPNTGASIRIYKGHSFAIYGIDLIDSDTVVSVSGDMTIQVWRISTGETIKKINGGAIVFTVKVLLNGSQIVCGFNGNKNNLRIYNPRTGDLVQSLNGHTAYVNAVEVLSDEFIVSGGWDTKVIIWNLTSHTAKFKLTGHSSQIYCLKLLSSNLMASGDLEGKILIWNWLQGTLVYELSEHTSLLFLSSLDLFYEKTLMSGSRDKTIKFWNLENGKLIQSINTTIEIGSLGMLEK